MNVAFPWVLWATAAAVAAVVVAHLLSVRQPPVLLLPTARFLVDRPVRAVSRAATPSDRWLLLTRVLVLLACGVAFAGITISGPREAVARLVVIDTAGGGTDSASLARGLDSLRATLTDARPADSKAEALRVPSLAAAFIAARHAASTLADDADSIELIVLSPLRTDATDAALEDARSLWPGRVTLLRTSAATDSLESGSALEDVSVRSAIRDDVVTAAMARWNSVRGARVRVVRDDMTADDSAFARSGGVVVAWPANSAIYSRADSATQLPAVIANGRALIASGLAPLRSRDSLMANRTTDRAVAESPDSSQGALIAASSTSQPIVWWANGEVAATQTTFGNGCVRDVGFATPLGDALLDVSARGVIAALISACDARGSLGAPALLSDARVAQLAGSGALAATAPLRLNAPPSTWTPWLLLLALLLAALEMLQRARRSSDTAQPSVTHAAGNGTTSANSSQAAA